MCREGFYTEDLSDLYFELSNEDRLEILYRLEGENMNISGLARELGLTTQECSRHVSRLSDVRLIERTVDGAYTMTPFGRLSLRLIPGQLFVTRHKDYFNTHTLERMPSRFVSRLHELRSGRLTQDVWVTFSLVESLFREAEECIWMIHDQYLLSILPLGVEALKRGVTLRSIDPLSKEEHRRLDSERPDYIGEEDEELFVEASRDGALEVRLSDVFDVFLYVSDKSAVIAFPLVDGSFDYVGFASDDEESRGFCRDVFEHYWGRSREPTWERVRESLEARRRYHREKPGG